MEDRRILRKVESLVFPRRGVRVFNVFEVSKNYWYNIPVLGCDWLTDKKNYFQKPRLWNCHKVRNHDYPSFLQKLEDQLNSLQPDFEHLMNDAKDLIKQLGNLEKKGPVLDLSRRMSGAHANLAVRKKSLRHANVNYFKMKSDLASIQVWLEETEKALRSSDEHKIKVSLFLFFLFKILFKSESWKCPWQKYQDWPDDFFISKL